MQMAYSEFLLDVPETTRKGRNQKGRKTGRKTEVRGNNRRIKPSENLKNSDIRVIILNSVTLRNECNLAQKVVISLAESN